MRSCATTLEAEMTEAEHDLLLGLLKAERFDGRHLEVGTAAGGTLCAMMRCFDDQSRPSFVVVDRMTYFPNQMEIIRRNLRCNGLDPGRVDFRVATSADALAEASRRRDAFDFILLDGSHKVLAVTADLRWTRLLNVGGVLCVHDYCRRFPGVLLSVNRFLNHHPNYARAGQADSLLAIRKLRESRRPEVSLLDRAYSCAWYLPLQVRRKVLKWQNRRRPAA